MIFEEKGSLVLSVIIRKTELIHKVPWPPLLHDPTSQTSQLKLTLMLWALSPKRTVFAPMPVELRRLNASYYIKVNLPLCMADYHS